MRSSSGLYVSRLDHVRALAAFMVYCWHFVHAKVPYAEVPAFPPLSLLEEGHAGVALFMTLSGYLFAKIMDGRRIELGRFYWNRFWRLAPLLAVVLAYWAIRGKLPLADLLSGLILPVWPGGTWSIVVELHFYAAFPVLLMLQRRHRIAPLVGLLALAIAVRTGVWLARGEVQSFAYWTIGGCIDLFVLGMLGHELARHPLATRHAKSLCLGGLAVLTAAWHAFNLAGGFYGLGGDPSPSPVWIVLPTVQGLCFAAFIVGYERLAITVPPLLDRAWAKVGEVSYSIYLVHFIAYPSIVKRCAAAGLPMDDLGVALLVACATFPAIVAASMVSYALLERPFLALRRGYLTGIGAPPPAGPAGTGRLAPA